jgi:3-hydroxyacyl-[acyl-carrier-protein] dehydratase
MLVNREDIIKYIPQRWPMVMIDGLVDVSEVHAVTEFEIQPDNIFIRNKELSEPGLVENIAQTAAVQVGFLCMQKNITVPIGYIAAIKDLKIFNFPSEYSRITTTITVKNQVLDITLVEGNVRQGNEILCCCEMRIFAKVKS